MSAAACFGPDGDPWLPFTIRFSRIPRGERVAAMSVYAALMDLLPRGRTELGPPVTDAVLRRSAWLEGYSERFVQKGLKALEDAGLIARRRRHGCRTIAPGPGLAGEAW
jgi:hypothetical protein